VQYDSNHGNRIHYSRIWHDPVIFPVIPVRSQSECLSHDPVGQLTTVCIAAHYKIVLIKIADKLAMKIIYDKNGVYGL